MVNKTIYKKIIAYSLFGLFFITLSSFGIHKFYVAVYQINYASEKKMLQITSRIFIDDLNKALEKKYNKKLYLGTEKETPEELVLLKKYLSEHFSIQVNEQPKAMNFLSKEIEDDVIICYWNVKDISKIKSIEIFNSVLTDWNSDQQNIVHVAVWNTKKSFLFTDSNKTGLLKK